MNKWPAIRSLLLFLCRVTEESEQSSVYANTKIKAMLGMLGGGENMSENLSGCLFTLWI